MAFDFPSSPTVGQQFTPVAGTTYVWNGYGWSIAGSGTALQQKVTIFTASGTFTPSASLAFATFETVGGGAGGGGVAGGASYVFWGGGGGAGGYSRATKTAAQIGASQSIVIGAAGNGGAAGNNAGQVGGDTFVGASFAASLCGAHGGLGGAGCAVNIVPFGGAGGAPGIGDITSAGAPGTGTGQLGAPEAGPVGGSSIFGGGAASAALPVSGGIAGANARGYGSGGSGGGSYADSTNRAGGNGSAGIVVVTEYIGGGAPGATGPQGPSGAAGSAGSTGPVGPSYLATSTTSNSLGLGSKTFTTQAGLAYTVGARARVASQSAPTVWMEGIVTAYSGTSLTINVDVTSATVGLGYSGWSTGDVKTTFKTTADTGWVMLNDGSIGDASSGATRANADTSNLFTLFFGNCVDADVPLQTSTGAATTRAAQGTAGAALAAHCRMVLPKALGRALAVAGAGSGLTSRALGKNLGEETHSQTAAEMLSHLHTAATTYPYVIPIQITTADSGSQFNVAAANSYSQLVDVGATGSSTPFNQMQPTVFLNVMVCL